MKYKIKEKNGDIKQSVIEKDGVVIAFTLDQVFKHQEQLNKLKKELEAKKLVEDAKKKNIEDNHSFVVELSDEQRFTVHMYWETSEMLKAVTSKLEEVDNQIKEYQDELEEIKKQLDIKDEDLESKQEPNQKDNE